MRKAAFGLVCVGLLCAAGAAWAGEAAEAPVGVEALKKELAELRDKERGIRDELAEIEAKVQKTPEVVELRKAYQEADKVYQGKKGTDPAYVEAVKAEAEARGALSKVIREKVAASDEAKAVHDELKAIADRVADLYFAEAEARLFLENRYSPIQRALSKDPELIALSKAAYEAEQAHRVKPDKEARDRARKAYDDARAAKLKAMPEAQKFLARTEEAEKGRDELREAEQEARKKLDEIRRTVEQSEDADLQAVREKAGAASKAVREAYNGEGLNAARKPRDETRNAYYAKARELVAADPAAQELTKERDALREQMRELDKKIREAAKATQ